MTQRVVKFGVIGAGLMGREFASAAARWMHLNEMSVRPEIIAVCDKEPSQLGWFKTNIDTVKHTCNDIHALLDISEIDAVYCAVPHFLHAEIYSDIIKANKHFLGEKPFGMDVAQNKAINKAMRADSNLLVRCSSELPFFPGAQKVYQLANAGDMGEIIEVEACFLHSSDLDPNKKINWKRQQKFNGDYGCMGDLGMHVLHLPLRLGWLPQTVSAQLVNRFRERSDKTGNYVNCDTWDNATINATVKQDDYEFPMVLKTWRIAPGESNTWSIRVLGTKKSAFFTTKNPNQWQCMDYKASGKQVWQVEDLGFNTLFSTITASIFEFGFTDALLQMWAAFLDEINGGDSRGFHCATPLEASQHHAILTAALKAGSNYTVEKVNYFDV